jgi:hypothetical protein
VQRRLRAVRDRQARAGGRAAVRHPRGAETSTYGFLRPGDLARLLRYVNGEIIDFTEGRRKNSVAELIETVKLQLRKCGYRMGEP